MKKNFERFIVLVILVVLLIVALFGCNHYLKILRDAGVLIRTLYETELAELLKVFITLLIGIALLIGSVGTKFLEEASDSLLEGLIQLSELDDDECEEEEKMEEPTEAEKDEER